MRRPRSPISRATASSDVLGDVLRAQAGHRHAAGDARSPRCRQDGDAEILDDDPERMRVAFVGRPNVGKSTLVNRILGEERMIASDVPGTTRDSIAVDLERDGRKYRLIDTAGLRRKGRVEEAVEKFSIVKTLQAIEQCQVAVIMLDAVEGVTEQDASVLGAVLDAGRALVVARQQVGRAERLPAPAERSAALAQAGVRRLGRSGAHLRAARLGPARTVQGDPSRARVGDAQVQHRRNHQGDGNRLRNQPAAGRARPRRQAALRASGRREPADLHRARHAPAHAVGHATAAISKTSSASASSSSARRSVSSSRKARTRTRTSRRTR